MVPPEPLVYLVCWAILAFGRPNLENSADSIRRRALELELEVSWHSVGAGSFFFGTNSEQLAACSLEGKLTQESIFGRPCTAKLEEGQFSEGLDPSNRLRTIDTGQ